MGAGRCSDGEPSQVLFPTNERSKVAKQMENFCSLWLFRHGFDHLCACASRAPRAPRADRPAPLDPPAIGARSPRDLGAMGAVRHGRCSQDARAEGEPALLGEMGELEVWTCTRDTWTWVV